MDPCLSRTETEFPGAFAAAVARHIFNSRGGKVRQAVVPNMSSRRASRLDLRMHNQQNDSLHPGGDPLIIKKKNSWFHSFRDVVQKGALQAKAAVDAWRDELAILSELERKNRRPNALDNARSPSDDSSSSSQKSHLKSAQTFSSKSALSFVLHGASGQSPISKGHSLHNTAIRSATTTPEAQYDDGNEQNFQSDESPSTAPRRPSVASMVGIIRTIGRRKGRTCALVMTPASPGQKVAEKVPLPSSPIDIPSTAPALVLDLGPAAFESTSLNWGCTLLKHRARTASCDSGTVGFGGTRRLPSPIFNSRRESSQQRRNSCVPPDQPLETTRDTSVFDPRVEPTLSPLGAMFPLEIDGSLDKEHQKKVRLFERSVTSESLQTKSSLHTVRSLDAVTEASVGVSATGDFVGDSTAGVVLDDHVQTSPSTKSSEPAALRFKLIIKPSSPWKSNTTFLKTNASATTIHSLPSSFPELTRQPLQDAFLEETQHGNKSKDITDDACGSLHGKPQPMDSTTISPLHLNCRAETQTQVSDATGLDDKVSNALPNVEASTAKMVFNPNHEMENTIDVNTDLTQDASAKLFPCSSGAENPVCIKTNQLLDDVIASSEYDHAISPIKRHHKSSSESTLSDHDDENNGQAYLQPPKWRLIKGRGSADYQFDFDKWINHSAVAKPTKNGTLVPGLNSSYTSTSRSPTGDGIFTAYTGSATTPSDHKPSTGGRLDFDLKLSRRDSQCTAPQETQRSDNLSGFANISTFNHKYGVAIGNDCNLTIDCPASTENETCRDTRATAPSPEQHESVDILFSSPTSELDLKISSPTVATSVIGPPEWSTVAQGDMRTVCATQTITWEQIQKFSPVRLASESTMSETSRSSSLPDDDPRVERHAPDQKRQLSSRHSHSWHRAFKQRSEDFTKFGYNS